jgi:uncharacterized protein (TIGR03437 family)
MNSWVRRLLCVALFSTSLQAAPTLSIFGFSKQHYRYDPANPMAGCVVPPVVTSFLTTDADIHAFALVENVAGAYTATQTWIDPGGKEAHPYTDTSSGSFPDRGGFICYTFALNESSSAPYTPAPGIWTFRLIFNGTILISRQVEIIQPAGIPPCHYKPSNLTTPLTSQGGVGKVDVEATPSNCGWRARSNAPSWISLSGGWSSVGSGSVWFTVAPNPGMPRTATLDIADSTHTVMQSGSGVGCSYALDGTGTTVPRGGGKATLKIFATPQCEWTAKSSAAWIRVTTPQGAGDGVVEYEAEPNPSCGAGRSASIDVGGKAYLLTQPPGKGVITVNGVLNAGSYASGPIAPGELVTIFGDWNAPAVPATMQLSQDKLTVMNSVSGVRLLFDGVAAPLLYVSAQQVNAVVPYSVGLKAETKVELEHQGCRTDPVLMSVKESAPAIFTMDGSGKGQIAALNQDYTPNGSANSAARGSVVTFWATGGGQTDPSGIDGGITQEALPRPLLPVTVWILGREAEVLYAGAAPNMVAGVMQINVRVPDDTSVGDKVPIQFGVGSAYSQPDTVIAVR